MRKFSILCSVIAFFLLIPQCVNSGNRNVLDNQEETAALPVPPLLLKAMALRIQEMDEPSAQNVSVMIEDELSVPELKRVWAGTDLWIYAKGADVKMADGENTYDFKEPDAFVLQVSHAEHSTVELIFKNRTWCENYRKAYQNMDFVLVPYFSERRDTYIQPGSFNRLMIEEDSLYTVRYQARYFVEPVDISPYDIVSAIGEPAADLVSLAESRGYVMADRSVNEIDGTDNCIFLSKDCKLSKNRKGVLNVKSNGKKYTPYSYFSITKENDNVKDVFFREYGGNEDEYFEALISSYYLPDEDTYMSPVDADSGYSLTFKNPQGKTIDLRSDSSGFITLQSYP